MMCFRYVSLIACLCFTASLNAQDTTQRESSGDTQGIGVTRDANERVAQARLHFNQAQIHFDSKDYLDAIAQYELAAQQVPSADLWFNIARCHELLIQPKEAAQYYRRYLRDKVDPPDRDDVEKRIAELLAEAEFKRVEAKKRPDTGTLAVTPMPHDAQLTLNGQTKAITQQSFVLNPGQYQFELNAEHHIPFRSQITIERGVASMAHANLLKATEYRTASSKRKWTWITAGLAVAALGTSVFYSIKSTQAKSDDIDLARTHATHSDYALGTFFGLGISSLALYYIEGASAETERIE